MGQTQTEIGKDLDICVSRMSIIVNSPLMQLEVKRLEDMRDSGVYDVTLQLQELAPTMLEACERIAIFGKSESLRLGAAQDLLDRAGFSKVNKVDAHITTETHEQRLARLAGIEVDITPEENVIPKIIDVKDIDVKDVNDSDAQTMSSSTGDKDGSR